MTNVKLDIRMHNALRRIAEEEFSSISTLIKQAIDKHLKDKGVDWREESD